MGRILTPMRDLIMRHRRLVTPRHADMRLRQGGFFTPMGFVSSGFHVSAAALDGSTDYLTRGAGLSGAADSRSGILSAWFLLSGSDGASRRLMNSATTVGGATQRTRFSFNATNSISCIGHSVAGTTVMNMVDNTGAYVASATWYHMLASWNLPSGTAANFLYVNDANVKDGTQTATNTDMDYTLADWSIGGNCDGTDLFNGALAEFYFAPGQYLDFSVEANRRKFISAALKPVRLGGDGSLPTGTAPAIYQSIRKGQAVSAFLTNRGSGGNFTDNGSIALAATSPSD